MGDGIYSAWGFAAFTALLIALSAASFRFYEVPARRHIERRFQRGEAAPPACRRAGHSLGGADKTFGTAVLGADGFGHRDDQAGPGVGDLPGSM